MTYAKHCAPSRARTLCPVLVASALVLGGCANWSLGGRSTAPAQADAIERSQMRLTRAPHAAAECIVENARGDGGAAELVPLYGLESVAVTVRDRVAGETLAVFSLMRNAGGSQADTTTWAGVADRAALLRKLTQGC